MLKKRGRVGWVVGGSIAIVIFIVTPVYFSMHLITPAWFGMDKSEEKSQVVIEEVGGKITKTTTTIKTEQAKTLWDWMSLFFFPAYLTILGASLGFWLQASQEKAKAAQAKAEKEKDEERQRDDDLEAYINGISDLLVGNNLSTLAKQKIIGTTQYGLPGFLDVSMDVIRARTLLILRRFVDDKDQNGINGERKGSILLFLYDTGLLRRLKKNEQGQDIPPHQFQALLSLKGANLTGANLFKAILQDADLLGIYFIDANLGGANLRGADLRSAHFGRANLSYANLSDANLIDVYLIDANLGGANLRDADLRCADIRGADLRGADLCDAILKGAEISNADFGGADLRGADLDGADLSDAILLAVDLSQTKFLTLQQLEREHQPLLCKIKLPENIKVDPDRDCKKIPEVLLERYPEQFKTLKGSQAYVDKQTIPL